MEKEKGKIYVNDNLRDKRCGWSWVDWREGDEGKEEEQVIKPFWSSLSKLMI